MGWKQISVSVGSNQREGKEGSISHYLKEEERKKG